MVFRGDPVSPDDDSTHVSVGIGVLYSGGVLGTAAAASLCRCACVIATPSHWQYPLHG